jgi:hypothetical protein
MLGDGYQNTDETVLYTQTGSSVMDTPNEHQKNANKNLKNALRNLVNQKIP